MANRTNRWVTPLVLLFAMFDLSIPARGQQAFRSNDSQPAASSFQAPPNFEKQPQRVPPRAANPVAFSNAVDEEWLPGNQRHTSSAQEVQQASFTTPSVRNNGDPSDTAQPRAGVARPEPMPLATGVDSATTYTPTPAYTQIPAHTQTPEASTYGSGKSRSGIPLKPPSKDVQDLAPSKSSSSWSSAISMVFSLLLVIGIFLGLSWIFRKTSPTSGAMLPKEVVEIIGRTPMANRQQLYVIRFGRKLVLVSQQVGQTEVLSEIDDRTEVDHLLGLCEQTNSRSVTSSFRNVLQQVATSADSKWSLRQRRSKPSTSSLDTLS